MNASDILAAKNEVEQRFASALHAGSSPLRDRTLAPLIRASPLFFAQSVLSGPPFSPFHGRLLFNEQHYAWEDIVTHRERFVVLAARGQGKSWFFTFICTLWRIATQPGRKGFIFGGTDYAAQRTLEEVRIEIESNPKLQFLLPTGQSRRWTAKQIRCSNGHSVTARGMHTRTRGAHPDYAMCDDILTDEDGWSELKRKRTADYYYSTISNMVMPGGQLGVVGCVSADTLINSVEMGLIQIGRFAPKEHAEPRKRKHQLIDFKHPIIGRSGARYTSHFWCNGYSSNYSLTLKNGFSLTASARHPLWVMDSKTGKPAWKKMNEMRIGDYVALKAGANTFGPSIVLLPVHKEQIADVKGPKGRFRKVMRLPPTATADLGYLVGLWIAEGSRCTSGRVSISNTEPFIREWLYNKPFGMAFRPGSTKETSHQMIVQCQHFYHLLKFLGLETFEKASKKSIPDKLMSAPKDVTIGLLQGIYDGDGCVEDNYKRVILVTTSEKLARQTQDLLLNLGVVSSRAKAKKLTRPTKLATARHLIWTVICNGSDAAQFCQIVGFRLPRKKDKAENVVKTTPFRRLTPHQGPLVAQMMREWYMRKIEQRAERGMQKGAYGKDVSLDNMQKTERLNFSELRRKKRITNDSLSRVIQCLGMRDDPCEASLDAERNLSDSFSWVSVKKISKTEGPTYDFVVPKDHTFLANGFVCHNTPMSNQDLVTNLSTNPAYHSRVDPALDSNGQSTWPEVWPTEWLLRHRSEIGSVRFDREKMCRPVSEESSLFPTSMFHQGDMMQHQAKLGAPAAFWRSVGVNEFYIGVDFAFSASVSADCFVIMVLGVDSDRNRWIVEMYRDRGVSFSEQKSQIVSMCRRYPPVIAHLEANQAQRVAADELRRTTDLPIRKFTTTAERHSLTDGLPSLRILLENCKFRIPRGDARSVEMTDILIAEAGNFTWVGGRARSVGGHDDCLLATWLADRAIARGSRVVVNTGPDDSASRHTQTASVLGDAQVARSIVASTSTTGPPKGRIIMRHGVPVRVD